MFREIGSNFWLEASKCPHQLIREFEIYGINKYEKMIYASSGRGALSLILDQIKPANKRALLPIYYCESIALPLISRNYEIFFYDINKDLTINEESLFYQMEKEKPGLVYFISYFGFDTLKSTRKKFPLIKAENSVIIEDISHLLFSRVDKAGADYYLASLRKWIALPDGGVAIPVEKTLKQPRKDIQKLFVEMNLKAMNLKFQYVQSSVYEIKDLYREMFRSSEALINRDHSYYCMSETSKKIWLAADFDAMCTTRRENFRFLSINLESITWLEPVFNFLPQEIIPMYFPVYVKCDRTMLQNHLASNDIYVPVHWPIPESCSHSLTQNAENIYRNILSIPCDQRYDLHDMARIFNEIKEFETN